MTTKADIKDAFEQLCKVSGHRVATKPGDVGAWVLNHTADGYRIEEYKRDGSTEDIFGAARWKPSEFYSRLIFGRMAVLNARRK